MTYELAKQLKDAGFPQVWPKPDFLNLDDALVIQEIYDTYPEQFDPYRPTLPELVDACGNHFGTLELDHQEADNLNPARHSFIAKPSNGLIQLIARNKHPMQEIYYSGKTPDVAAANLWLALNKKPI